VTVAGVLAMWCAQPQIRLEVRPCNKETDGCDSLSVGIVINTMYHDYTLASRGPLGVVGDQRGLY
jgi:hypothetical protein